VSYTNAYFDCRVHLTNSFGAAYARSISFTVAANDLSIDKSLFLSFRNSDASRLERGFIRQSDKRLQRTSPRFSPKSRPTGSEFGVSRSTVGICLLSFDAQPGGWWPREFASSHTGPNREHQSPIDTTASYSARIRVQDLECIYYNDSILTTSISANTC